MIPGTLLSVNGSMSGLCEHSHKLWEDRSPLIHSPCAQGLGTAVTQRRRAVRHGNSLRVIPEKPLEPRKCPERPTATELPQENTARHSRKSETRVPKSERENSSQASNNFDDCGTKSTKTGLCGVLPCDLCVPLRQRRFARLAEILWDGSAE
jgi:hypothetical protein